MSLPFRFEADTYKASLPGRVKNYYLLRALRLRTRSKDNEAARRRLRGVYENRVTFRLYVEEADDTANKVSRRPEAHPAGERITNQ